MRRYLSWIEGLTTNQYVGGSNPSRRTTYMFKPLKRAAFLLGIVLLHSVPYSRLAPDTFIFNNVFYCSCIELFMLLNEDMRQ